MHITIEKIRSASMGKIIEREREFDFCEFLRLLRSEVGLSRHQVAKQIGVSEWKIYHWEKGHFKLPLDLGDLVIIADYYKVSHRLLANKMHDFITNKKYA